jgi:hypothetical protein
MSTVPPAATGSPDERARSYPQQSRRGSSAIATHFLLLSVAGRARTRPILPFRALSLIGRRRGGFAGCLAGYPPAT